MPPPIERVRAAFPALEILELIGQGGMGFVYKARQPNLDRLVALKLLWPRLATQPAFAERFNREARVLARLNHPNIVAVYDFGMAGEFFFLLMEFVDGVNMRQAMKSGRFSPSEALALVPRICDALQFAHEEGILHRDIKPENILLDTRGRLKIADFGIAKLLGERPGGISLTETGVAVGTPHYMAPEQLERPQDVDQRADIYSLGVVFYEMLTGELPVGRFGPPSEKSPVDPRVDEVVLRALERQREKRYANAGEVKTRVEDIRSTHLPSGPHGTVSMGTKPPYFADRPAPPGSSSGTPAVSETPEPPWSKKAIAAALCSGVALVPGILSLFVLPFTHMRMGGAPVLWIGVFTVVLVLGFLGIPALTGTLLGVAALRDIRRTQGRLRGVAPALCATLFWPMLVLDLLILRMATALVGRFLPGSMAFLLVPILLLVLAAGNLYVADRLWRWAVHSNHPWFRFAPAAVACVVLVLSVPFVFLSMLVWLPAMTRTAVPVPQLPTPMVGSVSERGVKIGVTTPAQQAFTVSCTVLSNRVAIPGFGLRAQLPPARSEGRYTVEWQKLDALETGDVLVPWEVIVEDRTSGGVAARLRPEGLPELNWSPSSTARDLVMTSAIRQSTDFEVARAFQPASDAAGRPTDWSLRLEVQSSALPSSGGAADGVDAQFTLPAGQVAIFEVVTRDRDTVVCLPGMAAYVIAAPDESATGKFRCGPVPDENILERWRWPWRVEISYAGNQSAVGGSYMPEAVAKYGGQVSLWKALQADSEAVHWAGPGDQDHPALGLRIRTLTNPQNLASRNSAAGIGTNWVKALSQFSGDSR